MNEKFKVEKLDNKEKGENSLLADFENYTDEELTDIIEKLEKQRERNRRNKDFEM